jgi:hypothetical protein
MALDRLLKKLESRDSVTPVTPAATHDVTPKPAPPKACTPVTSVTSQNDITALLARFRLHECENDPEPDLIQRINDIVFHLVINCAFEFDEALTAAAQWVATNPPHQDEAAFTDVYQVWRASKPGDADRH